MGTTTLPPRILPVVTALLLAACAPSATPSPTAAGLPAAAAGVCAAEAALPDVAAAERAFTNDAHDALHALAGDADLDRGLAADVLEAMEQVEADFENGGAAAALTDDLAALRAAAEAALSALGEAVPACD